MLFWRKHGRTCALRRRELRHHRFCAFLSARAVYRMGLAAALQGLHVVFAGGKHFILRFGGDSSFAVFIPYCFHQLVVRAGDGQKREAEAADVGECGSGSARDDSCFFQILRGGGIGDGGAVRAGGAVAHQLVFGIVGVAGGTFVLQFSRAFLHHRPLS